MDRTAEQKISRAIDIKFHWLHDKMQKKIIYYGEKERKTWRIMSQNTTQYGTTELCGQDILNQQKKT